MTIQEEKVQVATRDGRALSALLVKPEGPSLTVLMSPGVVIPKERYLTFAKAGAERGAAVLIYDCHKLTPVWDSAFSRRVEMTPQ